MNETHGPASPLPEGRADGREAEHSTTLKRLWKTRGPLVQVGAGWEWACTCGASGSVTAEADDLTISHAGQAPAPCCGMADRIGVDGIREAFGYDDPAPAAPVVGEREEKP